MQQIEQVTTIIAHPHDLIHLPIKYFAPTSGHRTQFLPFAFLSITFRGTQFHRSKQFKSLFLPPPPVDESYSYGSGNCFYAQNHIASCELYGRMK